MRRDDGLCYIMKKKTVTYLRYTLISESCPSTIKVVACIAFKDDCFMPPTAINVRLIRI